MQAYLDAQQEALEGGTLADAINDAIAELTIAQECLAAYDPDGENWALRRKVRSALDCARLAVADAMVLA